MPKTLGTLLVDLALNTAGIARGVRDTNKRLSDFAKRTKQVARLAATAFAGISIANVGKEIVNVVDKYTSLQGRLKLVAKEGEDLAATQKTLFEISQATRNETGSTIDLYTRLARSTKDLNLNQQTLFKTTELINKAITISGATAQESSAALFQLGQGLSAGALRGEELNSVMEQTPRLAQAIADGLGVTIAELRKMGSEGQLTSAAVIEALENQASVINKEFGSVPQTVGQAYQQLKNDIENIIKTFSGFGNAVRESINEIREFAKAISSFINSEERAAEATKLYTQYLKGNEEQLKRLGIVEQGVADLSKASIEDMRRYIKAAQTFGVELERNAKLTELTEQIATYQSKLGSLQSRLGSVAEGTQAYKLIHENLGGQLEQTKTKLDELTSAYINVATAQNKSGNTTKESAQKHAEYVAGLIAQESIIRKNLSTTEAANAELIRTKALYDGNLISLESYNEKLQKLNRTIEEANPTGPFQEQQTGSTYSELLKTDYEAQQQRLAQDREFRLQRFKQAQDEHDNLIKLEQEKNRQVLGSTSSLFGSLASIVGGGSKKAFNLSKQLARAQTIVSTYAAAQQAFQASIIPGDPTSVGRAYLAAAAAVAAGAARLAAINRTTFSSSSATVAQTGAGVFVPSPTSGPLTTGQSTATGQTFIIITDNGVITDQQLDQILDGARDRINEGSQVIIRRDSVQAAEIAAAVA